MNNLYRLFESLEEEDEIESGTGDVSSFPDPLKNLLKPYYEDFQKVTGFTIPLSKFQSEERDFYRRRILSGSSNEHFGLEYSTAEFTPSDPLVRLGMEVTFIIVVELLNPEYQKRYPKAPTVGITLFMEHPFLTKSIPLALYEKTEEKGIKRKWLRPGLKKKN